MRPSTNRTSRVHKQQLSGRDAEAFSDPREFLIESACQLPQRRQLILAGHQNAVDLAGRAVQQGRAVRGNEYRGGRLGQAAQPVPDPLDSRRMQGVSGSSAM